MKSFKHFSEANTTNFPFVKNPNFKFAVPNLLHGEDRKEFKKRIKDGLKIIRKVQKLRRQLFNDKQLMRTGDLQDHMEALTNRDWDPEWAQLYKANTNMGSILGELEHELMQLDKKVK